MKKTSILPILLTACVMLTTSCLGDTEEVNLSGYDDAAIIAFSLGTLNQYTYTKDDDGEETLSKTTYNGANYKFYIDQDKGEIYNPDSLPYGTDAAHVICIATSKNSGYITMRAIDSEDMVSYSSSDSIDFTSPRIFYVTSLNSERQRQYTVKVNVHQQESDKFYWNQRTTNAELSTMTDLRALVCGTKLFVFGAQQGEGANSKQRIRENMAFIQQTMQQNRELINKLRNQLRQSSVKGDQLRRTLESLTQQMEEKDAQLKALQAELQAKNIQIQELTEQVTDLSENVSNLKEETTEKSQTISQQDKQLHTAWFVFGTKKELKEQRIIEDGEVLRSNFNQEYFTKIDIRVDKEIKLYSRSAKLLTDHPASSYKLEQDANKQYVLRIENPSKFWSTSKYLVILVK